MTISPFVEQSSPALPTIDPNDPRLTEDILHLDPSADAYSPIKIQHGLYIGDDGKAHLKPEIALRLTEDKLERIDQLLFSGRESEANSYAGCHLINKVLEVCPDGHEAVKVPIRCGKLFLCGDCASPGARVHAFHYDHPYLYEHLMQSKFSVLTFTIEEGEDTINKSARANLEKAQEQFERFLLNYDLSNNGWYFFAAFSHREDDLKVFERTMFHAIHLGDKLPDQPTLNRQWKAVAGPQAHVKAKLFDGRDGDTQYTGLKLAMSGFEGYYAALMDLEGWPHIDFSQEFRGYPTAKPYGTFYGFNAREEKSRQEAQPQPPIVDLCLHGKEHPHAAKCSKCGKDMVTDNRLPLMTDEELEQRYGRTILGHTKKPIYGRVTQVAYGATTTAATVAPSPPS
jgi:hypothetical protein